ncbi:MAG: hypothetical protein WDM90_23595 [Ferruginibacter sp.]
MVKKLTSLKTDYVLRALMVPAGKHAIEFKLEPSAYINGVKISKFFSWVMILLLLGTIGWQIKKSLETSLKKLMDNSAEIKVLALMPYKFLPAKLGGQKHFALFFKFFLLLYLPLVLV